jgi:DNA-binding CsgD family transcriptional regulator
VAAGISLGQPYEHAYALVGLARRALDEGRTDEAQRTLEEALAVGQRLGAGRLLDTVREAAGRGRIRLSDDVGRSGGGAGKHGLTGRELEVLRLLAEGYGNERIGGELYISPKTASVHVSRILAKLGVSSRGEASAWAHREGIFVDQD